MVLQDEPDHLPVGIELDLSLIHIFFDARILQAAVVTLYLTAIAMVVGVGLGILLAVMRLSPNRVMAWVSWLYIWFFRGTPVLVQIFFWWNINTILPYLSIGIPFTHVMVQASTNTLVTPLLAAILGLGLNEAAYMAEIVRAGIISVDHGQTEAAQALGMRRSLVMRRIVLPQACLLYTSLPYHHSNLDCDSVLYYVEGNYASRRGVQQGSLTHHVSGLAHGPQPGALEASQDRPAETDELAVMIETFRPLHRTQVARQVVDTAYPFSCLLYTSRCV